MKILYLVRHAKSSWDNPGLDDIDRPLNKRGKSDAPEMGDRLKKRGIIPSIIISSPAKRAFTTAKKIARKIDFPREHIKIIKEIYEGSSGDLMQIIKSIPGDPGSIMLFGHNPGITEFANVLCGVNIYNIPTCGIVSIQFDAGEWNRINDRKGTLVFFDYPKKSPDAAS